MSDLREIVEVEEEDEEERREIDCSPLDIINSFVFFPPLT